ncbi:MAG: NADH-quinone oxidoreductase subunit A [Gemmataceae bacterium]
MTLLVFVLLIFLAVGTFFLFIHLMIGKLIRPAKPEDDKLTIYECGEPTVGSAWIQFDLRYYVVALLFVIFDVEVAFFFPWAVVFGQSNDLSRPMEPEVRAAKSAPFNPRGLPHMPDDEPLFTVEPDAAHSFAWLSMVDIGVFFGVLLMGFAYLWRRGDIDWVRSTSHSPPVMTGLSELPYPPEVEAPPAAATRTPATV